MFYYVDNNQVKSHQLILINERDANRLKIYKSMNYHLKKPQSKGPLASQLPNKTDFCQYFYVNAWALLF
jgi:hypothetical protein